MVQGESARDWPVGEIELRALRKLVIPLIMQNGEQTPIAPSAFSSFLGNMHRRLSGLVSPEGLDDPTATPATRFGVPVPNDRSDESTSYMNESPSLHRAG